MTFDEWREKNKWCDPDIGKHIWGCAAKAEREACALLCEENATTLSHWRANEAANECAALIRARGE